MTTRVAAERRTRGPRDGLAWPARLAADRGLLIVGGASTVATVLFATFSVLRHQSYNSAAMDFAFFDQIVWNTSQGRWFETSFIPYNFMGQHVEPILLLFAGLYWVTPAPEWLLIVQSAAAGGATVALYLLTRQRLERGWLAGVVALAFLLSPALHAGLRFDYHSEVLASLFVFGGLAFLFRGRTHVGVPLLLGLLLLKEDTALVLVGLALPLWLASYRREAATVLVAGLLWIMIVVGVVMPSIRGGESDLAARYDHLGSGAGGIAAGIVRDPLAAVEFALAGDQQKAIARTLFSQGGMPLAAPLVLLSALPAAMLQLLSNHPPQQEFRLQYGAQVLPLVTFATVEGLRRIERWRLNSERVVRLAAVALAVGAIGGFVLSSLSGIQRDLASFTTMSERHEAAVASALRMIPPDAAVSAQSGLAAHLAHRERIWEFPIVDDAEYVIVDLDGLVAKPHQAMFDEEVARLPERGFRLIWQDGSVRVYRKE